MTERHYDFAALFAEAELHDMEMLELEQILDAAERRAKAALALAEAMQRHPSGKALTE